MRRRDPRLPLCGAALALLLSASAWPTPRMPVDVRAPGAVAGAGPAQAGMLAQAGPAETGSKLTPAEAAEVLQLHNQARAAVGSARWNGRWSWPAGPRSGPTTWPPMTCSSTMATRSSARTWPGAPT